MYSDGQEANNWFEHDAIIKDGRHADPPLKLDINGFELRMDRRILPDYYDESALVWEYYQEAENNMIGRSSHSFFTLAQSHIFFTFAFLCIRVSL